MIPRNTTVNVSAAPATPSASSVSHSQPDTANTANAAPHTVTATSIARPCRDTRPTGPDAAALTMPPTPIAAENSPSVRGSPPNRSALIAGNNASGSPKNVAFRSARKAPARILSCQINERPAPMAASGARSGDWSLRAVAAAGSRPMP